MRSLWILLVLLLALLSGGCVEDAERFLRPVPMTMELSS
jgi:hypothetical protein